MELDKEATFNNFKKRSDDFARMFPNVELDFSCVMEQTRKQYQFTYQEFADILGIPLSTYASSVREKRGLRSLTPLLCFCYVFGYDFETVISPTFQRYNDETLHGITENFGALSDATLEKFKTFLLEDPDTGRWIAVPFANAIDRYIENRVTVLNEIAETIEDPVKEAVRE